MPGKRSYKKKSRIPVLCECGFECLVAGLARHLTSRRHEWRMRGITEEELHAAHNLELMVKGKLKKREKSHPDSLTYKAYDIDISYLLKDFRKVAAKYFDDDEEEYNNYVNDKIYFGYKNNLRK